MALGAFGHRIDNFTTELVRRFFLALASTKQSPSSLHYTSIVLAIIQPPSTTVLILLEPNTVDIVAHRLPAGPHRISLGIRASYRVIQDRLFLTVSRMLLSVSASRRAESYCHLPSMLSTMHVVPENSEDSTQRSANVNCWSCNVPKLLYKLYKSPPNNVQRCFV